MISYKHPTSSQGLQNLPPNFPFPPHFLGLILGKPGTGKTSLLKFMLSSDQLFFRRYNRIFIVTPSPEEFRDLFLPKDSFKEELDLEWIEDKVKPYKNTQNYTNILLILDDVVADLKSESTNKKLLTLIFNRRHKLTNGMLSIIATSQKYKTIPSAMRISASFVISFPISPSELAIMEDELIYSDINLEKVASKYFKGDKTFIILNITTGKMYHEFNEITN